MIKILQLIPEKPTYIDGREVESGSNGNRYGNLENPANPTKGDIEILENYLVNDKHTKTLFICKNGEIAKGKWQYTGGFPEFKEYEGKYFSKMNLKSKKVFDQQLNNYKQTHVHIPIPNYEIVGEYENKKYVRKEVLNIDDYKEKMDNLLMTFYKQSL